MHRPITVERRKAGTEILMRISDLQKKLNVFKKQAETFDLLFSLTIQAKYLKPFAHVQNVLIQFYSPKNIHLVTNSFILGIFCANFCKKVCLFVLCL
jgi:hypothetical protein